MKRESNKAKDFARYKDKWGLTNYCFRIIYNNKIAVVPINDKAIWADNEIRTVHNLIKRKNNTFSLRDNIDDDFIEFDSLEELLKYMLIKKIALQGR